jgi:hypothetical protein
LKYGVLEISKGMEELHEKLSYIVFEGSSLTLMGLLTYDVEKDEL